jgi:hypothetical protein
MKSKISTKMATKIQLLQRKMMLMCNFELYIVVAIGKLFLSFLKLLVHQSSNYYWLCDSSTTRRAKFSVAGVSEMTMLFVSLL